jgi:hypothetical protein
MVKEKRAKRRSTPGPAGDGPTCCEVATQCGHSLSVYPAKLAEHYRELAEGEVVRANFALTNEGRADHYARAAEHLRLAKVAEEFGFPKAVGAAQEGKT